MNGVAMASAAAPATQLSTRVTGIGGAGHRRSNLLILAAVGDHRKSNLSRFWRSQIIVSTFLRSDWDCVVIAYSSWALRNYDGCTLVYGRGQWGNLVRRAFPLAANYSHVGLVLDDMVVGSVDPSALLATMHAHNASIISPGIRKSHHMKRFEAGPCLYRTNFIEVFYMLFTQRAWRCFTSMWDGLQNNTVLGWGFDFCLHPLCRMDMMYDNRAGAMVVHGRRLLEAEGRERDGHAMEKSAAHDSFDTLNEWVLKRSGTRCLSKLLRGAKAKVVACSSNSTKQPPTMPTFEDMRALPKRSPACAHRKSVHRVVREGM